MADEPNLSRGQQGEWVQYLQQLLERVGYYQGAIDGDFGPVTEDAVRSFQTANGLDADGVVGAATWAALTGEPAGSGGDGDSAGGGDVPQEFVAAGAPAQLSQWSEEQRRAYFVGEEGEDAGGDPPQELAVAEIPADDDGGSVA